MSTEVFIVWHCEITETNQPKSFDLLWSTHLACQTIEPHEALSSVLFTSVSITLGMMPAHCMSDEGDDLEKTGRASQAEGSQARAQCWDTAWCVTERWVFQQFCRGKDCSGMLGDCSNNLESALHLQGTGEHWRLWSRGPDRH